MHKVLFDNCVCVYIYDIVFSFKNYFYKIWNYIYRFN